MTGLRVKSNVLRVKSNILRVKSIFFHVKPTVLRIKSFLLRVERNYYYILTPQNLSIEICIKKIVSICIYVKIALTKKKKKKNSKNLTC